MNRFEAMVWTALIAMFLCAEIVAAREDGKAKSETNPQATATNSQPEKPKDDPKYFRAIIKKSFVFAEEKHPRSTPGDTKPTEEEREQQLEKLLAFMEQKEPKLLAASAELIDSFKNKTYDTKKAEKEIKRNIKLFRDKETELPVLTMVFVDRFEKEKMDAEELELARRMIGLTAEKLKKKLKKAKQENGDEK